MNKIKKVASFTVFSNDFKSKLTTAYPFLTPDQIQLKLRKKWNDLSPHERTYYHKAVLCPVVNATKKQGKPKKEKKISSKVPKDKNIHLEELTLFDEKKISSKVPKDKNIHLKELTLFDDDLELISDKKHEKDCFDNIFNTNEDDQFSINITKNSKTYMKSRHNVEHPVPMVIDETPFGQQGILKRSSSEKEKKMKVQFNFSLERNNVNQDKNKLGKNCHLSTLHKETKEVNIRQTPEDVTKAFRNDDVSSKPKNKVLNSEGHSGSLESNEEVSNPISSNNQVKPNQNLDPSEKVEPLTPELQRIINPMSIQKMCQAPRKRAIKGNFISEEKMDCTETKKNEALCIGNLDTLVSRRKPTFQKNNLIEDKFEFDSPSNLQFKYEKFRTMSMGSSAKRNKSLYVKDFKMMNVTKTNQCHNTWDFSPHPPSPSLDGQLDFSNTNENINTSIGWELSDEVSAPVQHSSSLENTLQLMKKSASSSLTSIVSNSSDNSISDCSSLSGFSELSDQELDVPDISDNEKSDEKGSCKKQCAIAGITAGGDLQKECQVLKKNKHQNGKENLLCDMFEDKHSKLIRILPPPGNNGEKITTDVFEEESIFGY